MKKYKCAVCGYIHDESENGEFDNVGDNYVCPICGAPKDLFEEEKTEEVVEQKKSIIKKEESKDDIKELDNLELSVICSNLSKGCEKQYMLEEAKLFSELSSYFNIDKKDLEEDKSELLSLINSDLEENFDDAFEKATEFNDRGALRSLTWSKKITSILKVLLDKYENVDLKNEKVYVCTICGFIFVGENLPDVCPVCKVQKNKFVEIEEN